MCGFAGCWTPDAMRRADLDRVVATMADTLVHRGPDDSGRWVDETNGIALGFRRLAILDLSAAGHQPMASAGGRFHVVFNGEIYNYRHLRQELLDEGISFRGASDTEVLLALVEREGVERAVRRLNGMFAIAIWDQMEQELWLARDPIGKKPLFYGHSGGTLLFGSELKAICAWPGFSRRIDRRAVASFVRYGYVPAPYCIYQGMTKVLPGELLRCRSRSVTMRVRYWDAVDIVASGRDQPVATVPSVALTELDTLLRESVSQRMVADVPLGAFLSGGIDSSLVVALMQQVSSKPVRTFTIGFDVPNYNEAAHAGAVARHLGTDHTELYVSPAHALGIVPDLPTVYDEPFADSSQIPSLLVAAMARQQVTVCLSGDGGDETFGGYTRYGWATSIWNVLRLLPSPLRSSLGAALEMPGANAWDRAYRLVGPVLPGRLRQSLPGEKMIKLAALLDVRSAPDLYRRLVSQWKAPGMLVPGADEYPTALDESSVAGADDLTFTERMMLLDLLTYLPDDILTKVDRATMAHGLEARAPLLDTRVIAWAWRQSLSVKIRGGTPKWLLRQLLFRYVPPALIERPKMGFGVPIDSWLRGPLRAWAEDLLSPARLAADGVFAPGPIAEAWRAHLSGTRNEHYRIWTILTFQAWMQRWGATL